MLEYAKSAGDYTLTNTVSAVWEGEARKIGGSVAKSKLKIKSGYGEFISKDGEACCRGPTDLDLVSNKKVILNKGN